MVDYFKTKYDEEKSVGLKQNDKLLAYYSHKNDKNDPADIWAAQNQNVSRHFFPALFVIQYLWLKHKVKNILPSLNLLKLKVFT